MKKYLVLLFFIVYFAKSEDSWNKIQLPCQYPTGIRFLNEEFGIVLDSHTYYSNEYLTTDGCKTFFLINDSLWKYNIGNKFGVAIISSDLILLLANQYNSTTKKYEYYIYKSVDSCKSWIKENKVYESSSSNEFMDFFEIKQKLFLRIQYDLFVSNDIGKTFKMVLNNEEPNGIDVENEFLGVLFEHNYAAEPYVDIYDFGIIYKNNSVYDTIVFLIDPLPERNRTKILYKILSLKNNKWVISSNYGFEMTEDNGKTWTHPKSNTKLMYWNNLSLRPDNFVYVYSRFYDPKSNELYITNNFKDFIRCQVPKNSNGFKNIKSVSKYIAYALSDSGLYKTTDGGGVFVDDVEEENIKESQQIIITNSKNSSFSLELKYPPSEAKLELINILGFSLFSQSTSSQLFNISLEPYPTGIYLLKYSDKLSTQIFKLLRE